MSEPREDPEPQVPDSEPDEKPSEAEPSLQEHHNPETEEDTASGGPA